jgi:hypothetical protein
MKIANNGTGWGFSLEQRDNDYLVGTTLHTKDGQNMVIVFEVKKEVVEVTCGIPGCIYDEKEAIKIAEELEFPLQLAGKSGQMLMLLSTVPKEIAENDTDIIVNSMMILMVDAITKIMLTAK